MKALVLLTALLVLTVPSFARTPERRGEIGADTPAGKPYIYKHSAGKPRNMEIYFPPNHDPAKVKVPGLILFHGGSWGGGTLAQFRVACAYFASRGLVCATAEYRMLTKEEAGKLPAGETKKRVCVTDAKSAIRWFKQHANELGIDPKRIITGGGSAGGHISALATMNPGLNDPADPQDIDTRVVAYLWFNPAFATDDVKDPEIDILRHLKADLPPAIVFFGDQDNWKKGWDIAHAKWQSLGTKTIDLQIAPGQSHSFFNKDPWQTVTLIAADRFLVKHGILTGEPTLAMPASGEKLVPAPDAITRNKVYYPQVAPSKEAALECFRDWPEGKSPAGVGKRLAQNFLPRGHYQDHELIRYPDAIVWFGALKLARETGDNELAGLLIRRFDRYLADPKLVRDKFHVDYAVLGIVPLELYRLTRDPALKKLGMDRADGQWLDPTADGVTRQARYWVDDIYMIAAIQTAAYRVTNDPVYLDRAALTIATYLKRLQKEDGLFWHAEDSPFVWGRGVGWYAAGMTEILKCLPASHPNYPAIMGGYRKMMAALLKNQAPSGLWRQLVDKPETWEETSGSGMFAYAMVTGVGRGWLDPEVYGPAARKAWLALVDQIDDAGNLQQVCVGTNKAAKEVGPDLEQQFQFYLNRPRVAGDYHGQAPLLWTAAALLEKEAE
jgi:rhamnogalacturonyl hydrolase YesR/acetyl esterase/lipase